MDLSDSELGSKKIVTWDMAISEIRQRTRGISSDMRHWHFLKSACDIRTHHQGPQYELVYGLACMPGSWIFFGFLFFGRGIPN